MSDPKQQQPEAPEQEQEPQEPQEDPNALTEQDKKVYAEIMGSIGRMNKKLESAKVKVPQPAAQQAQNPQQFDKKKMSVNQMTAKLIQAKENSDIVTKQDLITDVQQSFEQMVVDVYSENQQLKSKVKSLIAIIKQQNKKINEHLDKEEKLKQENQKLREELTQSKDQQMMAGRSGQRLGGVTQKTMVSQGKNTSPKNRVNTYETQGEDYDFWNMPQNESAAKRRKDFVADSGLWVNEKDIDKSVFITDQTKNNRRR